MGEDPIYLGLNCHFAECGMLEFLPFTCEHCHLVYCKDHHSLFNHSCVNAPHRDITEVREVTRSAEPCMVCDHADVTNVMCEECSFLHCMKHRLLEDHHCTSLAKEVTQSVVPVLPHSDVKGVVLKRKGAKSEALARKVMLMKLKNKSKGPAFIPQSERLYLNITRKGEEDCHYHFSNSWSVGRCVDVISDHLQLTNNNNKTNAERLVLLLNEVELAMNEKISEVVQPGDSVRVTHLPPIAS